MADINGTPNGDLLVGTVEDDHISGFDGNDDISGLEGNDTIRAGQDDDTITGGLGDDNLFGGPGQDLFIWNNGDGSDTISGGSGAADVVRVNGNDRLGDNFELRAGGSDVEFERFDGGPGLGNFLLDVSTVEIFEVNGLVGPDHLKITDLSGTRVEQVNFNGGDGRDSINVVGTEEDDTFFLEDNGTGQAEIDFNPITVTLNEVEVVNIDGGTGTDRLNITDLTGTAVERVTFEGEGGDDFLKATDAGVQIVARGGRGEDRLEGGHVADELSGGMDDDELFGNKGADDLSGGNGNDTIRAGQDNDTIIGGPGDDRLFGGPGQDLFIWNNGDGSDAVDGGSGAADVQQVNGADGEGDVFVLSADGGDAIFERTNLDPYILTVDNVESFEINGQGGGDTIAVEDLSGTDVETVIIDGGTGNDLIDASGTVIGASATAAEVIATGGAGSDLLVGGDTVNILTGSDGSVDPTESDALIGGGGSEGGLAQDTFVLGTEDTLFYNAAGVSDFSGDEAVIFNFTDGQDTIQLTGGEAYTLAESFSDAGSTDILLGSDLIGTVVDVNVANLSLVDNGGALIFVV